MVGTVKQSVRWALSHGLPSIVMRRQASRGDIQGRLVSQGRGMDAEAVAAIADEVRADGALHRSAFAHITASLPTVKEVLTSNDFRTGVFDPGDGVLGRLGRWAEEPGRLGPLTPPSLLVTEPPDHTRYRKLVTRVFTARAVEGLRVRTQEIADELLDGLDPSDPVELVSTYCSRLPVTVIAEILGVPPQDHGRVLEFGTAAAPSLDLGLSWSEFRQVEKGLGEFQTWLAAHLAHLRDHPGDDLMSQLVRVRDEGRDGGQGLSDEELMATAGLVLAAGFETTVNLLGNGIALLESHPDQRARLRDEPSLWSNAVDEVLRLDPPVLLTGRLCVADTEVAGQPVARGAVVTTLLAGANRDPAVFDDADRFDVARPNARDHVSFSAGRHFCLGAALARMEGEVGLRTLFDRFPDLEVLPGASRRSTRILRGYAELPVRLTSPALSP